MNRINRTHGMYGFNSSWYRDAFNQRRFGMDSVCDIFRLGWRKRYLGIRFISSYNFNHA